MRHVLATLIGYFLIAFTPAQAQGASAPSGDFPWLWALVMIALARPTRGRSEAHRLAAYLIDAAQPVI